MRVMHRGGECSLHWQSQASGAAHPAASAAIIINPPHRGDCNDLARLHRAQTVPALCSGSHNQSLGDLAGAERPQGLLPLRVDSGKGRLAFSNPQPTAFPSHAMTVSTTTCYVMQSL